MQQIKVDVAYALSHKQVVIQITTADNTTVIEAIRMSAINTYFPELDINPETLKVGVYGKKIDINTYRLKDNDRIEIYRPLTKSPNQKRLERARKS